MLASSAPERHETIEQLIEGCLQGDQQAWETIVSQYQRKVFNVAYKFVGRHDLTFDRRANFQTWLISVSRNLCIDHYRSVRKERELVDHGVDVAAAAAPVSREPDALAMLEQGDRRALLHHALAQLPDTLRTAVLLRDIQELTYQEIADRLDLAEGTVKSRINRGRKELARQIRRLMPEGGAMHAGAGRHLRHRE